MEMLLILGQVVLGVYFIIAGVNHFMKMDGMVGYVESRGLPGGKALTILSGIALLLAGLGVLLGLYVLWSLWVLVIFLVLASFLIHHFWSDQDPMQKMREMSNFMKNLALAAALLMLTAMASSWPWTLGLGL